MPTFRCFYTIGHGQAGKIIVLFNFFITEYFAYNRIYLLKTYVFFNKFLPQLVSPRSDIVHIKTLLPFIKQSGEAGPPGHNAAKPMSIIQIIVSGISLRDHP